MDTTQLIRERRNDLLVTCQKICPLPNTVKELVHENSSFNALEWIQSEGSPLTTEERKITQKYDASELSALLAAGELTATQVISTFVKVAALAHQLTNCATELLFEAALERARDLDRTFQLEGKPVGRLHGLPISVKDCFLVEGHFSTLGLAAYLVHGRDEINSPLVEILLKEGAIIIMKTNVAQTLMAVETDNNVFGRTLNPHNLSRTAGGSSGGEGALLRLGGSILGLGTDVGGSIRIPALCAGIYGFKTTVGRIPYGPVKSCSREGTPGLRFVAGPLARSAADLTLLCKAAMSSTRPWEVDAEARGRGWHDGPVPEKLRIGIWHGDNQGEYCVTSPIRRCLQSAAEMLRNTHHEVIEVKDFPPVHKALALAAHYFQLDDRETLKGVLREGCEDPIPALKNAAPESVIGGRKCGLTDVWDCNTRLEEYRKSVAEIWSKLDVLICPPATTVASPHDCMPMPAYTVLWNLLDFPASIIPHLRTESGTEGHDKNDLGGVPDGLPIGLQVVAWRDQDELLLAATTEIDRVLNPTFS